MPVLAQCQACGRRLRVPSKYVERLVTCTKCGAGVRVPRASPPAPAATPVKKPAPVPVNTPLPEPQTFSDRLGIAGMTLGVLSILIVWLPFLGYGSLVLSSTGVILAVAGLLDALVRSTRQRLSALSGGGTSALSLSAVGYACAGACVSLLALAVAMVVHAHR